MRVLDSSFDEVPHPLALLSVNGLLDPPYSTMLLLSLCIDEAVPQMNLPESFGLFSELCLSKSAVSEPIFKFFHRQFVRSLYVCSRGKA